jgi:hypothetical protein
MSCVSTGGSHDRENIQTLTFSISDNALACSVCRDIGRSGGVGLGDDAHAAEGLVPPLDGKKVNNIKKDKYEDMYQETKHMTLIRDMICKYSI